RVLDLAAEPVLAPPHERDPVAACCFGEDVRELPEHAVAPAPSQRRRGRAASSRKRRRRPPQPAAAASARARELLRIRTHACSTSPIAVAATPATTSQAWSSPTPASPPITPASAISSGLALRSRAPRISGTRYGVAEPLIS